MRICRAMRIRGFDALVFVAGAVASAEVLVVAGVAVADDAAITVFR